MKGHRIYGGPARSAPAQALNYSGTKKSHKSTLSRAPDLRTIGSRANRYWQDYSRAAHARGLIRHLDITQNAGDSVWTLQDYTS